MALLDDAGASTRHSGHPDAASEPRERPPNGRRVHISCGTALQRREKSLAVFSVLEKIAPRVVAEGVPALLASRESYRQDSTRTCSSMRSRSAFPPPPKLEEGHTRAEIDLDFSRSIRAAGGPPGVRSRCLRGSGGSIRDEGSSQRPGKKGLCRPVGLARRTFRTSKGRLGGLARNRAARRSDDAGDPRRVPRAAQRISELTADNALRRTLQAGCSTSSVGPPSRRCSTSTARSRRRRRQGEVVWHDVATDCRERLQSDRVRRRDAGPDNHLPALERERMTRRGSGALCSWLLRHQSHARGAWSTAWKDTFDLKGFPEHRIEVPLPDGATTLAGALHAGDRTFGVSHRLVTDGRLLGSERVSWGEPQRIMEFDPAPAEGAPSWPRLRRCAHRDRHGIRRAMSSWSGDQGAERSPFGVIDGLVAAIPAGSIQRAEHREVGRSTGWIWAGQPPDALLRCRAPNVGRRVLRQ